MVLLLFGPPGCGKGTQATSLAHRLSIPAISTGEMLRAERKAGTELGQQVGSVLDGGGLVDDDLVNAVVAARTSRADCRDGFLLDGYPRTVKQAVYFSKLLTLRGLPTPTVAHLEVSESRLIERLTARRQCPNCARIYNVLSQPSQVADLCDDDGSRLIIRADDSESVARRRLRAYHDATGPVLDWYGPSAVLAVDGEMAPADVTRAIENAVRAKSALNAMTAQVQVPA